MIFSKESIQAILENRKSQTRRLVKEGEVLAPYFRKSDNWKGKLGVCKKINGILHSPKWQVGKTLAVQPKRGAGGIGKCHACGALSYWIHKKGEKFPKQYF